MGLERDFWRGKRVLLTGHTGFKGAWLSAWLQDLGADTHGLALDPPTEPSLFEQAGLASAVRDHRADVRERGAVEKVLHETRPEVIIHMAAQSLVRAAWNDPAATFATNVLGTVHLLQAALAADTVNAVLVVTSDKCYANDESGKAFTEEDPLGGSDPYSCSKAAQEMVVASLQRPFADAGIGLASARSGNVIGGGDWAPDRLLPDAVRAFDTGQPLRLRYPDAVRPWQHVLDPLHGYLLLAQRLHQGSAPPGAWNFGPREADMLAVSEVAERLAGIWGESAGWETDGGSHPPEAGLLRLDSGKARAQLGWRNLLNLDESLAWTFGWYREWRNGSDLAATTRDQLQAYQQRCGVA